MNIRILFLFISCSSILFIQSGYTQNFAYGVTAKTELYSRYANPTDDLAPRSAGSALINLGLGPKLWFGGRDFSFSPEAAVIISPFALSSKDYKGLGALSFPLMGKFEFFGNSNFNKLQKFGFSIGAGIQYSKTELWYLEPSAIETGVQRPFFKTYVIEGAVGYGVSGFDVHFFVRYGWSKDTDANSLNIGIGYDFNVPKLIKETNPEF